jgi:aerobic carbon-monoxide dehydrogenase medium subunit
MLLRTFDYARPDSVDEAVKLLAAREDARALAGGQSLVNVMKTRVASPEVVVDLNRIAALRGISSDGGALMIGAMTTYAAIVDSPEVAAARPILAEVARTIADVQVRNRGTIGGNVCSNDPTNHLPALMVALGATMTIVGPGGERRLPATDFFLGVYATAAGPGELLTTISVPAGKGDGFAAVTIGKDGTCIVSAAASIDGERPTVAIGSVGAVPVVVEPDSTDASDVRAAVRGARLEPPSDVHASADYRRHLAEVLAVRAVQTADERRS